LALNSQPSYESKSMVKQKATRILVIGEDNTTTDLLKMTLRPGHYEVTSVGSIDEIYEATKTHNPQLIILDIIVQDNNELLLCKRIREFSQVPILVLSAIKKPDIVASYLDGGADGFLIKPVPNEILIAQINNLTRRAGFEREATAANY
jgi:two-component system, OmpR family, KDP operon response regulator KdpE